MKPAAALCLILLAAACARSEDASVRPAEGNDRAVEQVRSSADDDQEPALGAWRSALREERPALEFGPEGTAPLVTLVCADRGGLVLERAGAMAPGAAPTLSVSIAGQGRQLPVSAGTGPTATQISSIAAGDTLIQQMSAAQGPIALRFGDGTPLLLPQSPLIGQFAQSCASGGAARSARGGAPAEAPAAADPAAGNATNSAAGR